MYNFKLKNFLGSIIVLGGLLLSACNGGTGSSSGSSSSTSSQTDLIVGGKLSSAKAITAFSLNGHNGTIIDHNISVTVPFGTNVTSLIATFTTSGEGVTVNGVDQTSQTTPNDFTAPVTYVVKAANDSTQDYKVTVTESLPFAPYYPKGCTLNSSVDGESCECLQDTTTGDVWTRTTSSNYQCYNSLMHESGTCKNVTQPSEIGYIPNLNKKEMCGFKSGWNLPSESQLTTMSNYVSGVSYGKKVDWFNEHGFSEIKNGGIYWGQCYDGATNCRLPSGTGRNAWSISMYFGNVYYLSQNYSDGTTYGWGVHSSKP